MGGALVLAGGGVAGIAWEVGVLLGLQENSAQLSEWIFAPDTTFIGTSAGSVVATQIAGGVTLRELFDEQFVPESAAVGAVFDAVEFGKRLERLLAGATSALEGRQRIGRMALDADTMPDAERRAVLSARLTVQHWTIRRVLVTAVNAESGELRVFERESGVPLLDAVGASCAVPGVWPTVEIAGERYTDGGVRSIANADLAVGSDRVLILIPQSETMAAVALPERQLAELAESRVRTIWAEDAAIAAFGNNSLDSTTRAASATAGYEQGRRLAAELARYFEIGR